MNARSQAYRRLVNPYTPMRVFSDDQVEAIHAAALSIIENQGMKVLSAAARRRLAVDGAAHDETTQTVRLDRGLIARCLAAAPREITLYSSNPQRHVPLSGRALAFGPSSGAPNVVDRQRGRRAGTIADYENGVRLCQYYDVMHLLGAFTEPQDVPAQLRQLAMMTAQLRLSDKIPHTFCRGAAQIGDCFELVRIANGLSESEFRARPCTYTIINTNSPLVLDAPMADGIVEFASAGQVQMITPFTLAGAMAPVTIAGALTLAHAETLFGLALAQLVRPGAPVVYGSFTSNVDMKSGSPAFGTPEYVKAQFGAGQMARLLGLPWRSSNATASNVPDAQGAYESQMSLWGALLGGSNFVLHAAGWIESGLSSSYEKFILDVEQLQMLAEVLQPVAAASERSEAMPGYASLLADTRSFEFRAEHGAPGATERASGVYQRVLREFVPPPRDPAVLEAMADYVRRRAEAGGSPPQT
jgi:trimethylamine--corrinoid protein Co-methyltransferase